MKHGDDRKDFDGVKAQGLRFILYLVAVLQPALIVWALKDHPQAAQVVSLALKAASRFFGV